MSIKDWLKKDGEAQAEIGFKVKASCVPIISQAKMAKEIWDKLQETFNSKSEWNITNLKSEFDSI